MKTLNQHICPSEVKTCSKCGNIYLNYDNDTGICFMCEVNNCMKSMHKKKRDKNEVSSFAKQYARGVISESKKYGRS